MKGSLTGDDYHFGVTQEIIEEYIKCADIFHGLMCFRYGKDRLTPYMIKAVDIVPILLKNLPFHSLMRVSTEGGEHLHYEHQQHFFHHSARGGGKTFNDPILSIFQHMYRQIVGHILNSPTSIQEEFQAFVTSCKNVSSATAHSQQQSATVNSNLDDVSVELPTGIASEHIQQPECSASENESCLAGYKFVIGGSLQSYKITQETLISMIKENGGKVYKADSIPDGMPVEVVFVTSQRECDKTSNVNAALIVAVQRRWKVVSPAWVIEAVKNNSLPPLEQYELNLDKMKSVPQTSSVHVIARSVEETHFKRSGAFSDLKKTLKANASGKKRLFSDTDTQSREKRSHKKIKALKRPPNGYMMFVKENAQNVKKQLQEDNESSDLPDVNKELSQQWKHLSTPQKSSYKRKGEEFFTIQSTK